MCGWAGIWPLNRARGVRAGGAIAEGGQLRDVDDMLTLAMADGTAAWRVEPDGSWTRHALGAGGEPLLDLQDALMTRIGERRRPRTRR